ncbi:cell division protein FtsQ/DivIB [Candidatus Proelusimicrobium volucris]|uniref:cell division protein FtsQ/DivIB n=1 Tax=Candidatus Proelusimicrobium volucris TaxID=3416225 RepID=UPI003D1193EB
MDIRHKPCLLGSRKAGILMLSRKKKATRRFAPIRGKREKALRIKRIILVLSAFAVIFAVFFVLNKAADMIFDAKSRPQWLQWHVKKINVGGEDGAIAEEVKKYITFKEGDAISYSDCSALEGLLEDNLKELKKVSVWRNYFTGDLNVKIKKHEPFGRIETENKNYLFAENGLIFNDDKSPRYEALLKIKTEGEIKGEFLSKEFVELVKAVKGETDLSVEEFTVNMDKQSFGLTLKGAYADMGGLKDGAGKIKVLERVMAESARRGFKEPFKIDFNYFNDGKIYLKPSA